MAAYRVSGQKYLIIQSYSPDGANSTRTVESRWALPCISNLFYISCASNFREGCMCIVRSGYGNPCEVNNGGCCKHAYCIANKYGRHYCLCHEGYTGDGVHCYPLGNCNFIKHLVTAQCDYLLCILLGVSLLSQQCVLSLLILKK